MKNLYSTIIVACCYFTCVKAQVLQRFTTDDTGIIVEQFDSLNKDQNRYNRDNIIHRIGNKFTYSYYHIAKDGHKYLMSKRDSTADALDSWSFMKQNLMSGKSVYKIIMKVKNGLSPFIDFVPDYNQTVIQYDYELYDGSFWNNEMTGIIENEKNVWMHPPRTNYFKILEINPFPYIKAPYEVGNTWSWKLDFGDHWSDKHWLEWKGNNQNRYDYRISDRIVLDTKIGKIECFVVEATAKSNIGVTKLTSYFNKNLGFVKLDYTNIDSTKTVIELEKVDLEIMPSFNKK